MNLRDLQYLTAVAEHLHFGKAAELCHVSQPTLSMQLKKLEEYLGVQLFERSNKHVMLTPIGHTIVSRAKTLLAEAAAIRQIAQNARDPLSGDVHFGIFPTLAPYFLPGFVPKVKAKLPHINLLLTEEKTPALLHMLEEGKLDCALLALPIRSESLKSVELFSEPFYLAVPASHVLAARKTIRASDLAKYELLLLEEGHCLRDQALEVCHAIGIGESNSFRATSLETLRQMVAAGSAITLMPKLAIREGDTLVRYIPFESPAPSRSIGLVWRATSARGPLFDALVPLLASRRR
ncbi:MAG: LysR family transcriptional regulator [Rickettsiales bacterium]|nr:LysR family transcriptional regulator [Rickettsiales bacterium]